MVLAVSWNSVVLERGDALIIIMNTDLPFVAENSVKGPIIINKIIKYISILVTVDNVKINLNSGSPDADFLTDIANQVEHNPAAGEITVSTKAWFQGDSWKQSIRTQVSYISVGKYNYFKHSCGTVY